MFVSRRGFLAIPTNQSKYSCFQFSKHKREPILAEILSRMNILDITVHFPAFVFVFPCLFPGLVFSGDQFSIGQTRSFQSAYWLRSLLPTVKNHFLWREFSLL